MYHQFHIPVMGIGFTIDTPVKVAHFNISSVISLGDDKLIEKMRDFYSKKFNLPFNPIPDKEPDHRADRITAYLNLVQDLVNKNLENLKKQKFGANLIDQYFLMLPDNSPLHKLYLGLKHCKSIELREEIENLLREKIEPGAIDVNIMTKLDKVNYNRQGEALGTEFNDAHAALRGFANSKLSSSVVLSAGMNLSLFNYITEFEDFFPDKNGLLNKKIVLKVSDYRSAYIQGKILAKKGIWVSEFRIESGLNCGGHAFATEGYLLGPILEEFKENRNKLGLELHQLLSTALSNNNRHVPDSPLPFKITVQGGIGTHAEHTFLMNHYNVNSTGWGTPFLLVPEAVNVDVKTLQLLCEATEDDLYLSNISPLGIPFYSLKGNTKDEERLLNIEKGRPGSACPKKYLALNKEYKKEGLCSASREYQKLKIEELEKEQPDTETYNEEFKKITDKSCICVGLGTSVLLLNNMEHRSEGQGVSICPGPNMAYFSRIVSLKEMIDHIYGRINILNETYRPHMFIKELEQYVRYLKKEVTGILNFTPKTSARLEQFRQNLFNGIEYYRNLIPQISEITELQKQRIKKELSEFENQIQEFIFDEPVEQMLEPSRI
jgi:hypothetical protein